MPEASPQRAFAAWSRGENDASSVSSEIFREHKQRPVPPPSCTSWLTREFSGQPTIFSGDEVSWRELGFRDHILLSSGLTSATTVMDRAALSAVALFNTSLTVEEQGWSRQLFNMLTLSVNGEALRRRQSVPKGEGADAQGRFC